MIGINAWKHADIASKTLDAPAFHESDFSTWVLVWIDLEGGQRDGHRNKVDVAN